MSGSFFYKLNFWKNFDANFIFSVISIFCRVMTEYGFNFVNKKENIYADRYPKKKMHEMRHGVHIYAGRLYFASAGVSPLCIRIFP